MSYQLNITFDEEALQRVYAKGQAVTLARIADSTPPSSTTIAWLMNAPFNNNVISWDEAYQIYVNNSTLLKPGASIHLLGVTPGKLGGRYSFADGAFAVDPAGANPEGFELRNEQDGPVVLGLALKARVNGTDALAATSAFELRGGEARNVSPGTMLAIFLATYLDDGTVLRMIPTDALKLDLSAQGPMITIAYNTATDQFEQLPSARSADA
ncbi:MAG: hypothetical protein KYX69_04185 [Sphingomonas sp.]|uniref:hypothetical protein n=1 Tax=Sphingomonas sp. TaxID=28214 RepID=UPI0026088978|nr:hypothetical protein [Sphingomonas sp.]MDK2766901.1 hypothetical protein [Sphingomonas sp.]